VLSEKFFACCRCNDKLVHGLPAVLFIVSVIEMPLCSTVADCVMLLADKVQEAMTAEEKEKLYAAIGYQESAAAAIYPKEVVLSSIMLFYVISKCELEK